MRHGLPHTDHNRAASGFRNVTVAQSGVIDTGVIIVEACVGNVFIVVSDDDGLGKRVVEPQVRCKLKRSAEMHIGKQPSVDIGDVERQGNRQLLARREQIEAPFPPIPAKASISQTNFPCTGAYRGPEAHLVFDSQNGEKP